MGGKSDEAKGRIKEATGSLTDNKRLEAEGSADRAKGSLKDVKSDVKDKPDHARDKVKDPVDGPRRKLPSDSGITYWDVRFHHERPAWPGVPSFKGGRERGRRAVRRLAPEGRGSRTPFSGGCPGKGVTSKGPQRTWLEQSFLASSLATSVACSCPGATRWDSSQRRCSVSQALSSDFSSSPSCWASGTTRCSIWAGSSAR